ncbi:hypothetical protein [Streptomyces roseolilacinus]|uniref:Integral membrane protein n=1 Tax=Streptomyces roseolilacinus TaxID=66904 RepID=A0A918EMH6_9ACTN|nr:hypothetical protein [Streptomyces roseolilacinus]GGQ16680.1 hypothetical protein GCM10010249_39260 [Streptomyces roseolilacinus]
MTASRPPLRALRAALFAAVCVLLSATGHALQSAHPVPVRSLVVAFGLTWALAWVAAGRPRGAPSIGSGLAAVQAVMHLMFATAQGSPGHPVHPEHFGHHADAVTLLPSGGMLMAHLGAAAVCGVWLARGERAFLRLARTAFAPLRPPLTAVRLPAAPRPPRRRPPRACRRGAGAVLAHTLSRRGPPRAAAPRATAPAHH